MLTMSISPPGTEVRFDVQDSVGRSSSSIPVIVGPGKPRVPLHVFHALIMSCGQASTTALLLPKLPDIRRARRMSGQSHDELFLHAHGLLLT